MITYIVLLRGINVTGKNKLFMGDLKGLCQDLGYTRVMTYIQSGNVVLQATETAKAVGQSIRQAIHAQFGYTVPVLVREAIFFNQVVAQNPFQGCDPRTLYVTLLEGEGYGEQLAKLAPDAGGGDRFIVRKDVVYLHCPNGYGRTVLNTTFFEARTGASATTRNWNTICKLMELAEHG